MPKAIRTFRTRVRGLWSPRHEILDDEGNAIGTLYVRRNRWGMVIGGEFRPEKGEVLSFERNPGLLRGQFSLWTDHREWLGSSLRPHPARRQIDVWTGGKPYRIVPRTGLRRGWRVVATKTGEVADLQVGWFGRGTRIQLNRKMDLELLLFCYFLGSMVLLESILPTSLDALDQGGAPAASKA